MIDQDLERRHADCAELVDAWKDYLELINRAVKAEDESAISPQLEDQFLQAKTRIAMLHDSFTDSLKQDKKIAQNMIDLVNRSISLKAVHAAHEAEQKKMEIEWHECFLLLNETVSTIDERRDLLADRNEFLWKLGKLKERFIVSLKSFLFSTPFKVLAGLAVVVFIIFGIPAVGIYDYDDLRDVEAMKKPLSVTFNVFRNSGGFSAPYMTMAEYRDRINGLDPKGMDREASEVTFDAAISTVKGKIHKPVKTFPEQEELADKLKKADTAQFHAWDLGNRNKKAYVYSFWFRRTRDAKTFIFDEIVGQSLASDIAVIRSVNVVTIIWAPGDEEFLNETIDVLFGKIGPLDTYK